ncbi:MAG TPA: inositol monophosphatase family protein [Solirubrobacteraceae bacterium]|nr:inositol monophosphatase family protein [Solirubrobacteraceae bacterium]
MSTGGGPVGRGSQSDTDAALLEVAVDAARMAGALLLERVRAGAESEVSSKSTPTDLVSVADTTSEQAIRELLARRRPEDGFLGEEGGSSEGSSGLEWVVDPLDGTVNVLFGIPQWAVSVAVRDEHTMRAGAVYDPNRDELFTATASGPAILCDARGEHQLDGPGVARERRGNAQDSQADPLARAMVATGLAYDAEVRAAQAQVLARLAPRVRDIRRFGSAALDLAWTAAGRYDAYYERTVKDWDIAAGVLICERAGLLTRALRERPGLPWGILAAPAELIEPLLELVDGS